jgi:hypothetical protein
LKIVPSITLPENLPLNVVKFQLPAKMGEEKKGSGNVACCTATQKKPTVCRLLTLQSHVPVKIAAPHPNWGHSSTPEISPTIVGLDPIAG